jgi:hypothetical protein
MHAFESTLVEFCLLPISMCFAWCMVLLVLVGLALVRLLLCLA